jgi:hypothetical protein
MGQHNKENAPTPQMQKSKTRMRTEKTGDGKLLGEREGRNTKEGRNAVALGSGVPKDLTSLFKKRTHLHLLNGGSNTLVRPSHTYSITSQLIGSKY